MKRREFLKQSAITLFSLAMLSIGCSSTKASQQASIQPNAKANTNNNKKILIAYFSWSGNTKAVAEEIHKQIGGDIVEIIPANPYSRVQKEASARTRAEQAAKARPPITTKIADFNKYDTIYLGYPNWCSSMPMPVATFIDTYNMSGKKVAPFFTHGGGGVQRCMVDLQERAKGANFTDYLLLSGSIAKNSQKEIKEWLTKIQ